MDYVLICDIIYDFIYDIIYDFNFLYHIFGLINIITN
jgi:hypothetical protein